MSDESQTRPNELETDVLMYYGGVLWHQLDIRPVV
jgi:hypothetical protein